MTNARSFARSSCSTCGYLRSSHQKYGASPRTAKDHVPGRFGLGGCAPRVKKTKTTAAIMIAAQPMGRLRIQDLAGAHDRSILTMQVRQRHRVLFVMTPVITTSALGAIVGIDRHVIVAEVGGEDDGAGAAAAEVEGDGDALAGEDARGVLLAVRRRLAVGDQRDVAGGQRDAA